MMIELLDEPLSLDKCVKAVRRSGSGGIVTFIGTVRDISDGNHVEFLEYEAYQPMALSTMEDVARETGERFPVKAMAIQHRVGRLQVGDDAVIIAVSCPHRGEAFEACRFAIDRLKSIVPIWKKEHGEGGNVWVGAPTSADSATIPGGEQG